MVTRKPSSAAPQPPADEKPRVQAAGTFSVRAFKLALDPAQLSKRQERFGLPATATVPRVAEVSTGLDLSRAPKAKSPAKEPIVLLGGAKPTASNTSPAHSPSVSARAPIQLVKKRKSIDPAAGLYGEGLSEYEEPAHHFGAGVTVTVNAGPGRSQLKRPHAQQPQHQHQQQVVNPLVDPAAMAMMFAAMQAAQAQILAQGQARPHPRAPAPVTDSSRIRCRFFPKCSNKQCVYVHPSTDCRFGSSCTKGKQCLYLHAYDKAAARAKLARVRVEGSAAVPCRFGAACLNPSCTFAHPTRAAAAAAATVTDAAEEAAMSQSLPKTPEAAVEAVTEAL